MNETDLRALDHIDALTHLRRMGVSERFIVWFWTSATLALLNVPLARCSAASLMRVFRLLLGRSGYQFGFPRTGLADLFAPGCRRSVEAAGGAVLTGEAVLQPLVHEGRFVGFRLSGGREALGSVGVMALPPQALAALAANDAQSAAWLGAVADDLAHFQPSPYISTMLWLDRKVTQERFWARVWSDTDLNTDFYDLSNIRPHLAHAPSLVVCNAIYAHRAWALSDEEIISRTHRELAEFAPAAAAAKRLHARVHRIPMAVPCPQPGTEVRRPSGPSALPRLHLAGDWMDTGLPCSMESAARSGALTAQAVALELGRSLDIARPPPETVAPVAWLRRHPARSGRPAAESA